jgi:ABC-type multidrug transport system fused ATPase/permease subunit
VRGEIFAIQNAIKTLYSTKTIVMLAHRLSTIQTADCFLVMKDGELVQIGTHEQLIKKDGYYKELILGQLT